MRMIEREDENRDVYLDPMESDEALEEYIERRRREFYEAWYRYLEGACR